MSTKTATLSPEELSRLVMARRKRQADRPASGVPRRPEGTAPPLSFAQQRLWLLDQLDPANASYNIPFPSRVEGPLDAPALAAAVRTVVNRHETLRSRLPGRAGEPRVEITPPGRSFSPGKLASDPGRLPAVDLSGLPGEAAEAEADRLVDADAARPFSLSEGPLFRAALVRVMDPGENGRHVLLLNVHHAIADGWSCAVLLEELSASYRAGGAAEGPPDGEGALAELPVQYGDFAAWQRERLSEAALTEQLRYWRRKLEGAPPVLELPIDRPRPAMQSNRGERVRRALDPALTGDLRRLARELAVTPYVLLLALFKILISRLAGQDDVVVGSPNAGRPRVELERLVGFFLNEMVLRTRLTPREDGSPLTVRDLARRVEETTLEAARYQEVPFERLIDAVQPDRQLARSPLFQVQFNLMSQPEMRLSLTSPSGAEARVTPVGSPDRFAKFDLNLYIQGGDEDRPFTLDMVYNADVFERPRAEEMLRQLEAVARQATANPDMAVAEISLRTPEADALLPDPTAELAGGWAGSLPARLADLADPSIGRPDAVAVAGSEEQLTYAELARRAAGVAKRLTDGGFVRGDRAAIHASREADLPAAILGVLAAGGAFLLLDPAYPEARIETYLRLARPRDRVSFPLPPSADISTAEALEILRAVDLGPDDLASITFTSGSTGEPKGVMGRHGPLTFYQDAWAEAFELGRGDRFGMLSALAHDPLQRDVFTPMWLGARLEVPHPDAVGAPGRLAAWALERRVSALHLTPAMMEILAADVGRLPARPEGGPEPKLRDLRRAFVVGELLRASEVARFEAVAPHLRVINLYGSTETQRSVSCYPVPPASERPAREAVPLGKGFGGEGLGTTSGIATSGAGVQLLILNAAGRPAGIGEPGEIHVRSRHLSRGYLDDPELSESRYLPNPFRSGNGKGARITDGGADRLYRTGDLGRYLPDGNVEFAGRTDHQVKVRGFRIETGEIETALKRHPAVEAAAVVLKGEGGAARLAAYVVAKDGVPESAAADLHAFLAGRLPDYMVPAVYVHLPALPLTLTGKVDRRALPEPEAAPESGEDYLAPRTAVEEELAAIWQRWLEVPRVGMRDDFFRLGGHSLLATQVLAAVRDRLGVELPLRVLFETPTPEGLATAVVEERARHTDDQKLADALAEIEGLSEEELDALLSGDLPSDDDGLGPSTA